MFYAGDPRNELIEELLATGRIEEAEALSMYQYQEECEHEEEQEEDEDDEYA